MDAMQTLERRRQSGNSKKGLSSMFECREG